MKEKTKEELEAENKTLKAEIEVFSTLLAKNFAEQRKTLIAYAKYNAKLRRLEQEESNFFRWSCNILFCIGLLMSILMWWCE